MIERRAIKAGMEQDVHTPWRKLLKLRRGYTAYVKRATNRRERRSAKQNLRAPE